MYAPHPFGLLAPASKRSSRKRKRGILTLDIQLKTRIARHGGSLRLALELIENNENE